MSNFRGKRAELNVCDDYMGERNLLDMFNNPSYMAEGVVTKSHREGDITIIDECKLTGVSIVGAKMDGGKEYV